jgi:hypothetical protein
MINVSRQEKQELLSRLDKAVYSFFNKRSKNYRDDDMKDIIRGLMKIQEGVSVDFNGWVLDSPLFRSSRLVQAWHSMSMDLSI